MNTMCGWGTDYAVFISVIEAYRQKVRLCRTAEKCSKAKLFPKFRHVHY